MKAHASKIGKAMRAALLVLLLNVVGLTNALAQDFTVGDLNYSVYYGGVFLTGHVDGTSVTGSLVIPETVTFEGTTYSVTGIGSGAFQDCIGLTSVNIPNSVIMIGVNAFRGSGLTSVIIPSSVSMIGIETFADCSALAYIMVDYGNMYYDSRGNCNAIIETSTNSLVIGCQTTFIPNSVTSIGRYAFSNCSGLTSIVIPNSVTSIGEFAFFGCPLKYITVEEGNTVYDSRENCNAIIETSTNELLVGSSNAFIPNSVTSIGEGAFYGCTGLSSVTIPDSVTSIGQYAFGRCSGLISLTIGNSVEIIGDFAFNDCPNIYYIAVLAENPPYLAEYGNTFGSLSTDTPIYVPCGFEDAYASCSWGGFRDFHGLCGDTIVFADPLVKSICVSNWDTDNDGELSYEEAASVSYFPGYPFYGSEITSFDEFQYFTGLSTLKSYFFNDCTRLTSIVLPNSITVIEGGAFSGCSNMNSLTIGNSVTSIGGYVFYGCNITNLTIGDSVTSIGEYAFESCSITKLTIGNALASISNYGFASCNINTVYYTGDIDQWCNTQFRGFYSNPLTKAQRLYIDNELITDLVIPETVTEIKDYAFCCAAFLTSVTIPSTVTSIGIDAFYNCYGLTGSLTIPYSVTFIGDHAFQCCNNLSAIYYTGDINQWCNIYFGGFYSNPLSCASNLFIDNELVTDLVIPETVSEIKSYAFEGAGCLNSLTISNSVTSIGDRAFGSCYNLTSLTIGDSVTSIGEHAFALCTRLADSLIIPNSVTSIGYAAFSSCRNFTSLTIGNSVTSIGGVAFAGCTGFTGSLTIPNSVTSIGISAFSNCSGFTGSLTIPNSVSSIDDYTFRNCSGLTSISIPYTITSIGKSAFYNCSNLGSMMVFATTPPVAVDSTSFYGVNKSIPVYVPYGTISAYQAADGWSEFTNYIEMDPPTNHYIPQGSAYSETMALYGVIQIDGVEQHSGLLEVGAFCGDECRGSAIASEFEITHRYLAILNIFGESGHQLTFKLYDHGLGEELELTSPAAITFDVDGYGNPIEPYVLNFTSTVAITATLDPAEAGTVTGTGDYSIGDTCTLTATANEGYQFKNWTLNGEAVSTEASYSFTVSEEAAYVAHFHYVHTQALATGWNWWSTYIEQEGIDGLEMLENSIGIAGVRIQGRDGITDQFEYQGTNYWYGSLNAIANEQMYKIRTNADCNAVIVGDLASPSNHPITISNGWNWIGFPCRQSQSLDEVMSGFTPEANDVIKGRNGSSTFISYGSYNLWYGTLTVLEPGQGYMYKSNGDETKTLTFQTERCNAVGNATKEDGFFTPNTANFSSNMLVTAVVEMDGQELRSEEYELAAFVGDECRGSVRLMYVEPLDRYVAFLLVYGDEPEEVHFVLTDGNEVVCSGDCLTYAPDGIEGTPTEPVTLHFGTLSLNESGQDVVNIFPNPSDGIFSIEGKGVRKIEVVDAYGQMILSKETQNDFERIDLSDKADGLYLLRVVTSNGITTKQLIKK